MSVVIGRSGASYFFTQKNMTETTGLTVSENGEAQSHYIDFENWKDTTSEEWEGSLPKLDLETKETLEKMQYTIEHLKYLGLPIAPEEEEQVRTILWKRAGHSAEEIDKVSNSLVFDKNTIRDILEILYPSKTHAQRREITRRITEKMAGRVFENPAEESAAMINAEIGLVRRALDECLEAEEATKGIFPVSDRCKGLEEFKLEELQPVLENPDLTPEVKQWINDKYTLKDGTELNWVELNKLFKYQITKGDPELRHQMRIFIDKLGLSLGSGEAGRVARSEKQILFGHGQAELLEDFGLALFEDNKEDEVIVFGENPSAMDQGRLICMDTQIKCCPVQVGESGELEPDWEKLVQLIKPTTKCVFLNKLNGEETKIFSPRVVKKLAALINHQMRSEKLAVIDAQAEERLFETEINPDGLIGRYLETLCFTPTSEVWGSNPGETKMGWGVFSAGNFERVKEVIEQAEVYASMRLSKNPWALVVISQAILETGLDNLSRFKIKPNNGNNLGLESNGLADMDLSPEKEEGYQAAKKLLRELFPAGEELSEDEMRIGTYLLWEKTEKEGINPEELKLDENFLRNTLGSIISGKNRTVIDRKELREKIKPWHLGQLTDEIKAKIKRLVSRIVEDGYKLTPSTPNQGVEYSIRSKHADDVRRFIEDDWRPRMITLLGDKGFQDVFQDMELAVEGTTAQCSKMVELLEHKYSDADPKENEKLLKELEECVSDRFENHVSVSRNAPDVYADLAKQFFDPETLHKYMVTLDFSVGNLHPWLDIHPELRKKAGEILLDPNQKGFNCDILTGKNPELVGKAALIQSIMADLTNRGYEFDPATIADQVNLDCGSTNGIIGAFRTLFKPGDVALVAGEEIYPLTRSVLKRFGAKPMGVPMNLPPEQALQFFQERSIDPRIKADIITSPDNPTGRTLQTEFLKELAEIIDESQKYSPRMAVLDAAYQAISYVTENGKSDCLGHHLKNTLSLILLSDSKEAAVPGNRAAYSRLAGDPAQIVAFQEAMLKQNALLGGGNAWGKLFQRIIRQNDLHVDTEKLKKDRELFVNRLNEIGGEKKIISTDMPEGGLYHVTNYDPEIFGCEGKQIESLLWEMIRLKIVPMKGFMVDGSDPNGYRGTIFPPIDSLMLKAARLEKLIGMKEQEDMGRRMERVFKDFNKK